eukprot:CAMPEP_0118634664 /NCGR_PEP_ID=MMETSP0785-20121206/1669_1 /TAXON_ID=91992 /ORGANISM="Bolidomonas pacifica, Strain CCMP 1866" /LENGTH=57 /DNA_ID=CAMNT_0006525657 /DNA_START=75 /DNA_END=244 /DNA_ORIENTATION=+
MSTCMLLTALPKSARTHSQEEETTSWRRERETCTPDRASGVPRFDEPTLWTHDLSTP